MSAHLSQPQSENGDSYGANLEKVKKSERTTIYTKANGAKVYVERFPDGAIALVEGDKLKVSPSLHESLAGLHPRLALRRIGVRAKILGLEIFADKSRPE